MRKPRAIALAIACLICFDWCRPAQAQLGIGLYKDGQLIDSFGGVALASNAAPKMLSAKVAGTAIPQSAIAPSVSADAQAGNQVFADATSLGIQIQQLLRQMREPVPDTLVADQPKPREQLASLLQQVIAKQTDVRAVYDRAAARLVEWKMPPEILQRHFDAVTASEVGFAAFANAVNDVLIGGPGALDKALELLNQIQLRHEPDLTRQGPTHQPLPILPAPQLAREQADALQRSQPKAPATPTANGSGKTSPDLSPPTPDDLAETPEVRLTAEIRAKAAALGNSPVAIYEFVRNTCAFQPYLGSRKGAAFTLQQLAGNDTDQASLLIALLRAAAIPCRYARGTVEMTPDQAKSWLGVDDAKTAGSILTTAGLDGLTLTNQSGAVAAIRCTRVWVEAYVPFANYRGVPNDDTGKTWIPLDPAFKETVITPGQDILAAMGYNNETFLANYISTYNSNSPIQLLTTNIQAFLNTNQPGKQVADIERKIATQTLYLGLLPASLPGSVLTTPIAFPSLDATNRFKIRFNLYRGATTFIDFTTNLSDLAGHQVTINYIGATTNDQTIIDTNGGIYSIPAALVSSVHVKPLLKVDGNVVAASVNSVGLGYVHTSDMYFTQPVGEQNVQPLVRNDITAGNSQALAFDTFMDVPSLFLSGTNAAPDALLITLLQTTALDYLSRVDRGEEAADRLLRTVHTVDVSEAIVESSVAVTYSYAGVPQSFAWTGLTVDADRRIVGPFAANGDTAKQFPFMLLSGYDGSFMESDVFEDMYDQKAVSTVRILQLARDQGIPTCYITNSISSGCPGFSHSTDVRDAVNNLLGRGHIVIIPRSDIIVSNWAGTGYIDLDPVTGAAAYIISGGQSGSLSANGGATVDSWLVFLPCNGTVSVNSADPIQSYFSDSTGPIRYFYGGDWRSILLKGSFNVTCNGRTTPQPFSHTIWLPIQVIDWLYGPGDYTTKIGSTVVNTLTIFEFKGILTPDDNFTGRSQKKYGLEEKVTLDATIVPATVTAAQVGGLEWTINSGVGSLSNVGQDGTADYDAGATAGSVKLRLTIKSGPLKDQFQSYDKTVVAPRGTRMTRASANVKHTQGIASAGILLYYWLDPKDVSFSNLTFGEGTTTATGATGIYVSVPPGDHPQNYFGAILNGDSAKGCRVSGTDGAFSQRSPWAPGGTYTWSIPSQYIDDTSTRHSFGSQNHVPTIQPNGDMTMAKGGHSGSAALNDPTSGW